MEELLEEPIVQVGDRIELEWPRHSSDNLMVENLNCVVQKLKRCKFIKNDSYFKYVLKVLDTGEELKTRLKHLQWRKLKKSRVIKTPIFSHKKLLPPHKYILAPMVGASELPFRLLCRRYGAQLAYTPMMNSERFAVDSDYRLQEFQSTVEDRPLVAHFSANNPDVLLAAARHVEQRCDAIDLNLGCPQRIAFSGHFGSYLLGKEDRVLVLNIVKTVSSQLSIPMFVKIRLLDTIEDSIELCFQLAKAGASLIAIHARYRVNLVGRTGPGARDGAAHLDQVKMIKESFTNSEFSHVPIITNGNVVTSDDVIKNLEMTRANGIMSAEGLLDNPTLFAPFMTAQSDHSKYLSVSKLDLALEYIELVEKYPTNMKPIIFHIRRMCRDDLTKYELLEACINANHPSEVKNIILKMKQYEKEGGFELDKNRILKAKEAMEKLKRQENHRKEYEKRMMRKAKREGKELDYYLRIGAELPSIQRLQELRNMTREESFSIWKQLHLQHCYAYHIHHHEGMKKCDRDRTCAFLHMDPSYSDEKEIYG